MSRLEHGLEDTLIVPQVDGIWVKGDLTRT